MKNTDRLIAEMLFEMKKSPKPYRERKRKHAKDITVNQFIRFLEDAPELKKKLEEAFKKMEPQKKDDKKDKDKLSLGQKYMLVTIAAVTIPPLYVAGMLKLFAALGIH
jgi:hypothetical protein